MRYRILIFSTLLSLLSACGPSNDSTDNSPATVEPSSTGFHANNGAPYSDAGDKRVEPHAQELAKAAPKNNVVQQHIAFSQSLEDFKLKRFDDGDPVQRRFGKSSFHFEVQYQDQTSHHHVIKFDGRFDLDKDGKTLKVGKYQSDTPNTALAGLLIDSTEAAAGHFIVSLNGNQAVVYFRAYKAHAGIRTDADQDLSQTPKLEAQIENLRKSSFWWVSNYAVPMGAAQYHYIIVGPSGLSFSGQSVQTGVVDAPQATIETKGNDVQSVELKGDSYHDSRVFSMRLQDEEGKSTEVMMDLDREAPEETQPPPPPPVPTAPINPPTPQPTTTPQPETPVATPSQTPTLAPAPQPTPAPATEPPSAPPPTVITAPPHMNSGAGPTPDEPATAPTANPTTEPPPQQPSQQGPAPQPAPQTQSAPPPAPKPHVVVPANLIGVTSRSFYQIDDSLTMTHKVISDWEKNWAVPQVQAYYRKLKVPPSKRNPDPIMDRYYENMNPLRPYVAEIASAYDFPAGFAFIGIVESQPYFSGTYYIEVAKTTSALGPFQIVWGTARDDGKMYVQENPKGVIPKGYDERKFFATSACGAARYLHNMALFYMKGDTTLAFMGYNQGETGAKRIAQVKRYGHNYLYDFATIASHNMTDPGTINYVAEILAAYFVSGNPEGYNFDLSKAKTKMPFNGVPTSEAHDPVCRDAIARARASNRAGD